MPQKKYVVSAEDAEKRLDAFLAQSLGMPRAQVQKLCENDCALVNEAKAAKNWRLKEGDFVKVDVPEAEEVLLEAEEIPLEIVYEDEVLLVVNKPKGMVVHPAVGNPDGTLVNALLSHCGDDFRTVGEPERPGIVHRIDKDTSGLLLVAKTEEAYQMLKEQLHKHAVKRIYEAILHGRLKEDACHIETEIARHPKNRKKMANVAEGRRAVTDFEVIAVYDSFTHVRAVLETGRTHQIRVHAAGMGHPVAGDRMYGPKKVEKRLDGQCLHARTLGFHHPKTGDYMEFTTPLPSYFTEFLTKISGEHIITYG